MASGVALRRLTVAREGSAVPVGIANLIRRRVERTDRCRFSRTTWRSRASSCRTCARISPSPSRYLDLRPVRRPRERLAWPSSSAALVSSMHAQQCSLSVADWATLRTLTGVDSRVPSRDGRVPQCAAKGTEPYSYPFHPIPAASTRRSAFPPVPAPARPVAHCHSAGTPSAGLVMSCQWAQRIMRNANATESAQTIRGTVDCRRTHVRTAAQRFHRML